MKSIPNWLIYTLIGLVVAFALYLLYKQYQKFKAETNAGGLPSASTGYQGGTPATPNATNSFVEPDWSKVSIPKTKAEFGDPLFKIGVNGDATLVLQKFLNDKLGANSPNKLKYDGIFGALTETALKKVTGQTSINWSKIPSNYIPANFYKI